MVDAITAHDSNLLYICFELSAALFQLPECVDLVPASLAGH